MSKRVITIALTLAALLLPAMRPVASDAAAPDVVADQWIVVDGPTGTVISANNQSERRPMASLTKVMTAVVALERGHLDLPVTITQGDKLPESSAGIYVGTTTSLRTLLHGLLLSSGNDAAMAIARAVGGSATFENEGARAQFIVWMNDKAKELGLNNTHFMNPHGLDEEGHYSTPEDLAALTRYALGVPDFREIFGTEEYNQEGYSFAHGNQLMYLLDNVVGGKTGWTDGCGRCLIEVVWVDNREVIIVLMGSDLNWYNDAIEFVEFSESMPRPADSIERAAEHFDLLWERTDSLVASGAEARTWLWGKPLGVVSKESSSESSTGTRYEQLFDKGLMEINHPYSEMDSGWYITPGRLAAELIAQHATLPVAGDLDATGPQYADLADETWSAQKRGSEITRWISSGGQSVSRQVMGNYAVVAGTTAQETGLATASIFEDYLWQAGAVVDRGATVEGLLFDPPIFTVGLPITEAFWVTVPENDTYVDVLVQCFERRCLTYTPSHESDWQIEMSNIGLHYQLWQADPAPARIASVEIPRDRPAHLPR